MQKREVLPALCQKRTLACPWITLWRYSGKYIVLGSHRATNALKRKIANWFDFFRRLRNRH